VRGIRKQYQKKLPWEQARDLGFPYSGIQLTEEEIRTAMQNSPSNSAAARYMGISLETFKKYAEMYIDVETGLNLYQLHKNQGAKHTKKPKQHPSCLPIRTYQKQIDNLLTIQKWTNPRRVSLLRNMLTLHGMAPDCCQNCGYSETRLKDNKLPLILHFVNSNRKDWRLENIKWLCYNCAFIMASDPFTGRVLRNIQSSPIVGHDSSEENNLLFYNLDKYYFEEINKMQDFIEDDRYTEVEDLIDYDTSEQDDLQNYIASNKSYDKPDSFDINDLIDRHIK
jgi:hypothetical protein